MVKRRQPGFTLVELLVVIGIIGLLVMLLVPTISKSYESVSAVKTRDKIKDISVGLYAFKDDFGDFPPSKPYKADDPASGKMTTGAANLVLYLRGPGGSGWGLSGAGAMPFGGPPKRNYGPYFQCVEEEIKVEVIQNVPVTTGFLDCYKPGGVILYLKPFLRRDAAKNTVYAWFDVTENNRVDHPNDPRYNYAPSANMTQQQAFDEVASIQDTVATAAGSATSVLRYKRQDFMLVSPGQDRCYGWAVVEGARQYDDITNWD
jgi:prepilin-type N-terminal cleavage/methylation domain-containing protein